MSSLCDGGGRFGRSGGSEKVNPDLLVQEAKLKYFAWVQQAVSPQPTTVCLLSSDPLLIADFQGLLYLGGFQFRTTVLNGKSLDDTSVDLPPASVYAIDAPADAEVAEAVITDLLSRYPGARILMVAANFSEESAFPLLAKGVRGLMRRGDIREQLSSALTAISVGGFWVPRTLLARFVDSVIGTVRRTHFALGQVELSENEQALLNGVLANLPDWEIAKKLRVPEAEIGFRISLLARKFGVRRRDDLVLLAYPKPA